MRLKDREYIRFMLPRNNDFRALLITLIFIAYCAVSDVNPHNIMSYGIFFTVLLVIVSTFGNLTTLFSEDANLFMTLPVSPRCVVRTWVIKSGLTGSLCLLLALLVKSLRWGMEHGDLIQCSEAFFYALLLIEGIFFAYTVSCGNRGSQSKNPKNIFPIIIAAVIIIAGVIMTTGKPSLIMVIILAVLDAAMHPFNIWCMKNKLAL